MEKLAPSSSTAKTDSGTNGVTVSISSNQSQNPPASLPLSAGISVTTDHFQTFEKRDFSDLEDEMILQKETNRPTEANMFDRAGSLRKKGRVIISSRDKTLSTDTEQTLAGRSDMAADHLHELSIGCETEVADVAMPCSPLVPTSKSQRSSRTIKFEETNAPKRSDIWK
jgi:hypothetical protein